MGGLARAYSQAGIKAISSSKLTNFVELHEYILVIKYNNLDSISKVIYDNNGLILDRNFDLNITLKIKISTSTKALIQKKFPMAKIQALEH
jgi:putative IMPACT (imprinted ancient) family translation regulator